MGYGLPPDKCSTIRISRSRKPFTRNYSLKGHVLTTEDSTRYLGVELQSNMAWNKHMDQTIKKGNSMLGFLRRNLKVSNKSTKTAAYSSLIRSILELHSLESAHPGIYQQTRDGPTKGSKICNQSLSQHQQCHLNVRPP